MNAVRLSHYPADPEFFEACDSLGLYVMDELSGWHGKHETINGQKLVKEMITRDVNHPCIIWWSNGNEKGWNTELDGEFHKYDPQKRPVLHPQGNFSGYETCTIVLTEKARTICVCRKYLCRPSFCMDCTMEDTEPDCMIIGK